MKLVTMIAVLFVFWPLFSDAQTDHKRYARNVNENGDLRSEGWMRFHVKTGYWKFYHENGKVAEQGTFAYDKKEQYWFFFDEHRIRIKEGHFKNDQQVGWWLFYDKKGSVDHKCQLTDGVKDGFCLKYRQGKLVSAEKYAHGKKIDEWENFGDFTKENHVSELK
ncbi:MAG: hypothetical protein WA810_01630 [Maribacter sp.]